MSHMLQVDKSGLLLVDCTLQGSKPIPLLCIMSRACLPCTSVWNAHSTASGLSSQAWPSARPAAEYCQVHSGICSPSVRDSRSQPASLPRSRIEALWLLQEKLQRLQMQQLGKQSLHALDHSLLNGPARSLLPSVPTQAQAPAPDVLEVTHWMKMMIDAWWRCSGCRIPSKRVIRRHGASHNMPQLFMWGLTTVHHPKARIRTRKLGGNWVEATPPPFLCLAAYPPAPCNIGLRQRGLIILQPHRRELKPWYGGRR